MEAIKQLLDTQVIETVPYTEREQGLYSILFTVSKKNRKWRAVLDLKFLNTFVIQKHFRMETLRSIAESLLPQDFLTSIDLTDAYLHVPIFPPHRRFLRFCVGGNHYQFQALPFGLSSAPQVFTKILIMPITHLRNQGIHINSYLDNILMHAPTLIRAQRDTAETLRVLQEFGFLFNWGKKYSGTDSAHRTFGCTDRYYRLPYGSSIGKDQYHQEPDDVDDKECLLEPDNVGQIHGIVDINLRLHPVDDTTL